MHLPSADAGLPCVGTRHQPDILKAVLEADSARYDAFNFFRINKIKKIELKHAQHFVHAFQAESAFAI